MRFLLIALIALMLMPTPAHADRPHVTTSARSAWHKPKPKGLKRVKVPRPSSIGPSKWYSGTEKYPGGDQDHWRWYAPTLPSGKRQQF